MANLEVGIGSDISDLQKGISQAEKELKKLEKKEALNLKAGLDTSEISKKVADAKKNLDSLKSSMNGLGQAAGSTAKPIANASNTLTNFSRIAQDAPFGIIGIGNNLTATAEAFSSLSKQTGGAGGALQALGSSLLGGGGVLLAISLVTTALTVMSQKGITVGDVFDKLSGNFNQFKKDLSEVNKEAAKNSAEEVQRVKTLADIAKDETLTRQKRLVAVQKLQEEYPAYFGNLTKEQILNGNVGTAIKDVVEAIKEKARAQALTGKLTDLAAKEFELRDKEAQKIAELNDATKNFNKLKAEAKKSGSFFDEVAWAKAAGEMGAANMELKSIKSELKGILEETDKWAKASTVAAKKSVLLDLKVETPKKAKKPKKVKEVREKFKNQDLIMAEELAAAQSLIRPEEILNVTSTTKAIADGLTKLRIESMALITEFNNSLATMFEQSIGGAFGGIGEAIGTALLNGSNVLESVGASLVSSMGSILSAIGDKLIALGAASLLASTVFSSFGTALGVGAALAAIAGGVALKAGGSIFSGISKGMTSGNDGKTSVSAGNSVSSPTSSVSGGSSFNSGSQTVVFEISGQSLVGVLSNTLNKNTKLGGAPAI